MPVWYAKRSICIGLTWLCCDIGARRLSVSLWDGQDFCEALIRLRAFVDSA